MIYCRFVEKQLNDVKKRQVTPLKNTPKRRRISVAGNILKSIEKLPSACNKTPERIPVVTQLVSSIEKLKLGMLNYVLIMTCVFIRILVNCTFTVSHLSSMVDLALKKQFLCFENKVF